MQNDKTKYKLEYILNRFRIKGELILYREIHKGNINHAYYTAVYDGIEMRQYLIQKINTFVFRDPARLMENIDRITSFIIKKQTVEERRRRLHYHHTDEGLNYLVLGEGEDAEYWRLCNYVEFAVSFDSAKGDAHVLEMCGIAYGRFEKILEDFDASCLGEGIPYFHDTRRRLQDLADAVKADPLGRAAAAEEELAIIRKNQEFGCTLIDLMEKGELPLRMTHNDTKTNNVLFDADTLIPLVVIDFDTCMPGLVAYDFGDAIRFAAVNSSKGEEGCIRKTWNADLYRAFTKGYLREMGDILTQKELDTLANGAAVVTLELAARYLEDYLMGDRYFSKNNSDQNLERAVTQTYLFLDFCEHMEEMQAIVREVYAELH